MRSNKFFLLLLSIVASAVCHARTDGDNHVLVREMLDTAGCDFRESVRYYDGIGRPTLTLESRGGGAYAATLSEYDLSGRVVGEWLPAPVGSPSLPLTSAVKSADRGFYGDSRPFSAVSYDALDRKTSVLGPGEAWADSGGHAVTTAYSYNASGEVLRFAAPLSDTTLVSGGYVEPGTLSVTASTDEDGRTLRTYTDFLERKVLERRSGGNDTYFVYDDLSRLRFVLPPAYKSEQDLSLNAYEYRYDRFRRCVWKRLPGCSPQRFGYDAADRMAYSQDGVQRRHGKATFYLYDAFGRLAVKGQCAAPSELSTDGLATVRYTGGGTYMGYECIGAPSPSPQGDMEILEANYYSDYAFLGHGPFASASLGFAVRDGYTTAHGSAKGRLTGRSVLNLSDGSLTLSAVYYDLDGNAALRRSATTDGVRDDRFTAYTFSGKPSRALHEHSRSRSLTSLSEETFYTYQPSTGRLLRTEHSINGSPHTLLSENAYDWVGRIVSSRSGGLSPVQYRYNLRSWLTAIMGPGFAETLRYTDGDRPQYGGNPSEMVWRASGDAQPRMYSYEYDSLDRLVAARYGGSAGGDYSTSYTYDAMGNVLSLTRRGLLSDGVYGCIDRLRYSYEGNRVIKIDDAVGADDGPSFNGAFHFVDGADAAVEYTYDENGNMMSDLNRGISRIDYNCLNLPQTVAFSNAFGYSRTIAYGYTADGEKTSATYITSTDLKPWRPSLPQQPSSSSSIAVSPPIHVTPLSLSSRTNYCGNITYENDTVSRVLVDGGYITFGRSAGGRLSSPSYHFYVKDHLGNNRAVVSSSGNVEETNSYYPFGGLMAVNACVRNVQPYKYIGKELDWMFGWNMLDHGARWYDAAICRWWSMDPKLEDYFPFSSYSANLNNPILYKDEDGEDVVIWYTNSDGNDKYFVFNGTQSRVPNNQFVLDVVHAYNFLKSHNAGENFIKGVTDPQFRIHIQENTEKTKCENKSRTTTVFWSSRKGLRTSDGGHQSPATRLEHEFAHAVDACREEYRFFKMHTDRQEMLDSQYENKEEKRVIEGSETKTAKRLGESVRKDHCGTPYDVCSPISTKPLKKKR